MVVDRADQTLRQARVVMAADTLVMQVDEAVMVPLTDHGIMVVVAQAATRATVLALMVAQVAFLHLQDQAVVPQVATTQAPMVYQLVVA